MSRLYFGVCPADDLHGSRSGTGFARLVATAAENRTMKKEVRRRRTA
jgi:hypothetical protein